MNKVNRSDLIVAAVLSIVNVVYYIFLSWQDSEMFSLSVGITFYLIQTVSLYGLLNDRSALGYSLNSMHWIFILIQFYYAPIVQIHYNCFPWKAHFDAHEILVINCAVLLWCLVYSAAYYYRYEPDSDWQIAESKEEAQSNIVIQDVYIKALFLISSTILLLSIAFIGPKLFLSRADYYETLYSSGGQIYYLLYNTFMRSFVLSSLMICLWVDTKDNRKYRIIKKLLLLYCIILYFPTNSGRTWLLIVYYGLFLFYAYRFKRRFTSALVVICGVVVIASFMEVFRNNSSVNAIELWRNTFNSFDFLKRLTNGDFDCYTMIGYTIRYIQTHGVTYGKQLLTALLFFVPRALWNAKGIGSGAFVIGEDAEFSNVSSPLIAEAIINFGMIGIILFAVIFGKLLHLVDLNACRFRNRNRYKYFSSKSLSYNLQLIYPSLYGFTYLVLRGDLLSSLSSLIGFITPVVLLTIVERLR